MYDNSSRIMEIDIDDILPNRFQPRIQFDEEEILELADSIKEHGIIQPIVVRPIGDKYEIVSGERRYKASVLAGKETMPVIIRNLNDKESAEIALIENVQRKSLTPIEEALSYKKILDIGAMTQENLAQKIGKSQSSIANKIRLLNLSDEVQDALLENKISERHARSLLRLETKQEQNEMLNKIISERLTVRKTDEEIEKIKNGSKSSSASNDDTQKIIEKGDNNMDNSFLGTLNVPDSSQSNNTFDIFGSTDSQQSTIDTTSQIDGGMPQTPIQSTFEIPTSNTMAPEVNAFQPANAALGVPQAQPTFEIPTINTMMPETNAAQPTDTILGVPQAQPTFEIPTSNTMMPETNVAQPTDTILGVPQAQPTFEIPTSNTMMPETNTFQPANTALGVPQAQPTFEIPTSNTMMPETNVAQPTDTILGVPQAQPTFEIPTSNTMMPETNTFQPANTALGVPQAQPTFEIPTSNTMMPETNAFQPANTALGVPQAQPTFEIPTSNTMMQESNLGSPFETNIPTTTQQEPQVPVTAPIVETPVGITQKDGNTFNFENNQQQENHTSSNQIPEFKLPEPIIVTDYSKQYDPVMPQTVAQVTPKIEFKEVIAAIRECSQKIEQWGYTIDLEEYDLENLYQVVFKINKE